MRGGGYGVFAGIILGLLGLVGGWVFRAWGIWLGGGMMASIVVALVGAVILVSITRLIKRLRAGFWRSHASGSNEDRVLVGRPRAKLTSRCANGSVVSGAIHNGRRMCRFQQLIDPAMGGIFTK